MNPADRGCDAHRNPKVMGSDVSGTVVALGTNTHTQAKQTTAISWCFRLRNPRGKGFVCQDSRLRANAFATKRRRLSVFSWPFTRAAGPGCTKLKLGDQVWGDIGSNAMWASPEGGELIKTKELGAWAEYAVG